MSEIIEVLNEMACEASISGDLSLNVIINKSDLSEELKKALLEGNQAEIESKIDARRKIVCMLVPAKDDDEDSSEEQEENEVPQKD